MQTPPKCDNINVKRLSPEDIEAINAALAANLRVEIVRTVNGIKLYNVKRKELHS